MAVDGIGSKGLPGARRAGAPSERATASAASASSTIASCAPPIIGGGFIT
jgi:hypothetical protein